MIIMPSHGQSGGPIFPPVNEPLEEKQEHLKEARKTAPNQPKLSRVLESQARRTAKADASKKSNFASGAKRFTEGK